MQHELISGDNHIDLTYCPADLWSAQAPAKWKKNAPRVEERNDGQHWFVDDKDRGYSERSYGRFERRIGLPRGIDRDKATATFKNGVLTVTLPRSEGANENVHRIPIHGAAA